MDEYIEEITETLCGRAISPQIYVDNVIINSKWYTALSGNIGKLEMIAPYYFRPNRIWCIETHCYVHYSFYYKCKNIMKNILHFSGIKFRFYKKFTYPTCDVWRYICEKNGVQMENTIYTAPENPEETRNGEGYLVRGHCDKKEVFIDLLMYAGCVQQGETWYTFNYSV